MTLDVTTGCAAAGVICTTGGRPPRPRRLGRARRRRRDGGPPAGGTAAGAEPPPPTSASGGRLTVPADVAGANGGPLALRTCTAPLPAQPPLLTTGPCPTYIPTHPGSAPTVKQHLAAIRMLRDWLVVSQVLPVIPRRRFGPEARRHQGRDVGDALQLRAGERGVGDAAPGLLRAGEPGWLRLHEKEGEAARRPGPTTGRRRPSTPTSRRAGSRNRRRRSSRRWTRRGGG